MKKVLLLVCFISILCASLINKVQPNRSFLTDCSCNEILIGNDIGYGDIADDSIKPLAIASKKYYNSYMEAYFSGLTENIGYNYKNSCGYVAIGMLLSYYDSFLDDNFISEKYDVASSGKNNETNMIERNSSPGIYRDEISGANNMKATEYYNKILTMTDYSFHAKLLTIGKSLGILKLEKGNDLGVTNSDDIKRILETYIMEQGVGFPDITVLSKQSGIQVSSDKVKEFVKNNINQGYPVILSAKKSNSDTIGHTMICYAYNGSVFYGNMGWASRKSNSRVSITSSYPIFTDAIVVKFPGMSHKHALNYEVKTGNETHKYCYCNSNICTYTGDMTKFDEPDNFDGNFVIRNWITSIGDNVFERNKKIKRVTSEDGCVLQEFSDYAFSECENLSYFEIPSSVVKIGNSIFNYCTNLKEIKINPQSSLNAIDDYGFITAGITNIHIPNKVKSIGMGAFTHNYNLATITIPSMVSQIGTSAISGGDSGNFHGKLTVYAESASKPSGWDDLWNVSIDNVAAMKDMVNGTYDPNNVEKYQTRRPVFWNCRMSIDKSYVMSFYKSNNTMQYCETASEINDPHRDGYTFGGWYATDTFTGKSYSSAQLVTAPDGQYYAKWI